MRLYLFDYLWYIVQVLLVDYHSLRHHNGFQALGIACENILLYLLVLVSEYDYLHLHEWCRICVQHKKLKKEIVENNLDGYIHTKDEIPNYTHLDKANKSTEIEIIAGEINK